jgi:predicted GNAT family acetyltransferase
MDQIDIRFEETGNRGRYSVAMPDGTEARLTYSRVGGDHVIADSTYVPPPFRGRQIAERMVERLFADARDKGFRITPTCWFVADEFARHSPEWDDVLKR